MTSLPESLALVRLAHFQLTLDDGQNSTLLDSRGTLETVGVDTWFTVRTVQLPKTNARHIPRRSSDLKSMESKESVISS